MIKHGWCWSHTQRDGHTESHVCEVVGTGGHELFDLVAVHISEVNSQLPTPTSESYREHGHQG